MLLGLSTGSAVAALGNISTFAGGGVAGANLAFPRDVAIDNAGNVYIADYDKFRVLKVSASTGIAATVAGTGVRGFSGDGGTATAGQLQRPTSVAVDAAGNLYIADPDNSRVRKVTAATGVITTVAGTGTKASSADGGLATAASLKSPEGVAVDSAGNIYIADLSDHRIRKVTAATGIISTVAGSGTSGFAGDNGPAIAAKISMPTGVAVDGSGNIYIADYFNQRIRKVAANGTITTVAGNGTAGYNGNNGPATAANLNGPYDVAVDAGGNLYIAEQTAHLVHKVAASTGVISIVAGNGTKSFSGDGGPATEATLNTPTGVAFSLSGNLYIADQLNNRIRMVADVPAVTAVPGSGSYTSAQTVTLTSSKPATIYYTTDGSQPTASSLSFSNTGQVTIGSTTTLKVMSVDQSQIPSSVESFTYTMLPGAPTTVTATATNGGATVNFTAPQFTGGGTIGSYTVTAQPGGITVTDVQSPITLSGLSNGTTYTVTVVANNEYGPGAASTAVTVTPVSQNSLTLLFGGTGGGSVNGGVSCTKGSNCPPVAFDPGTEVSLMATPDADSQFAGWSSPCVVSGSTCNVTVNGLVSVTANFTAVLPVKILGGAGYSQFSTAYAAAKSGDVIQGREVTLVGDQLLNLPIDVTFKGGYDTGFTSRTGNRTTVDGKFIIRSGTVVVEGIAVK